MSTIGESYLRPDPKCASCHGSGVVNDYVPWGNTTVPMPSTCGCVEENNPIKKVILEISCAECGDVFQARYTVINRVIVCPHCGHNMFWLGLLPESIVSMVEHIASFADGEYDDKTERELAEILSEALWPVEQ